MLELQRTVLDPPQEEEEGRECAGQPLGQGRRCSWEDKCIKLHAVHLEARIISGDSEGSKGTECWRIVPRI